MNIDNSFLFSIIIPVYNREDCIGRCMQSIAAQSFNSYELIIVNDGSTDDTLQKITDFESEFEACQVISYRENKGVNYARNRGIEKATGKFLLFLDSDDQLTDKALTNIGQYLTQYPNYSHFLFGVSDRIDDKMLPSKIHEYKFDDWLTDRITGDFAHVIKPSCFEGLMFIEEFRIYESLNWFRILRKNQKQLFIPTIIFSRERNRTDSVSLEYNLDGRKNILEAYNFIYQFVDWFYMDFVAFNISGRLNVQIKKAIMLGIALEETSRNEYLILKLSANPAIMNFYRLINKKILSSVFILLIRAKTLYHRFR